MLTNAKSAHKVEAIQKRALRFMLNEYESSYEDLLKKIRKSKYESKENKIIMHRNLQNY